MYGVGGRYGYCDLWLMSTVFWCVKFDARCTLDQRHNIVLILCCVSGEEGTQSNRWRTIIAWACAQLHSSAMRVLLTAVKCWLTSNLCWVEPNLWSVWSTEICWFDEFMMWRLWNTSGIQLNRCGNGDDLNCAFSHNFICIEFQHLTITTIGHRFNVFWIKFSTYFLIPLFLVFVLCQ